MSWVTRQELDELAERRTRAVTAERFHHPTGPTVTTTDSVINALNWLAGEIRDLRGAIDDMEREAPSRFDDIEGDLRSIESRLEELELGQ